MTQRVGRGSLAVVGAGLAGIVALLVCVCVLAARVNQAAIRSERLFELKERATKFVVALVAIHDGSDRPNNDELAVLVKRLDNLNAEVAEVCGQQEGVTGR